MKFKKIYLTAIIIISSLLFWYNVIYTADTLASFFGDEVPNTQGAVSFFSNGIYQSDHYHLMYSSGIASTWPSAIGWNLGHNLLSSRLACAFFAWCFGLGLGYCFFTRQDYTRWEAITIAVCLWAATTTTPFAFPYWHGFIYNVGEFNSVILIAFGILFLPRYPLISSFIFGMAVWHGKILYVLLAGAILLGNLLSQRLPAKKMTLHMLGYTAMFLLPLLLWMAWIYLRLDMLSVKRWIWEQMWWFNSMKSYNHGSSDHFSLASLAERFKSPPPEWTRFSAGSKIKNFLFSFGAIGLTMICLRLVREKKIDLSSRAKWITLMVSISIGIYAIHYFCFNPFMSQRYFHPALYAGLGLWVYWATKWAKFYSLGIKQFSVVVFLLLALQALKASGHPLIAEEISYARRCTDLHSYFCDPINSTRVFNFDQDKISAQK